MTDYYKIYPPVHAKCLGFDQDVLPRTPESEWKCPDCRPCSVCKLVQEQVSEKCVSSFFPFHVLQFFAICRTLFSYVANATQLSIAPAWVHHQLLCLTDATGLATSAEQTSRLKRLLSKIVHLKKAKLILRPRRRFNLQLPIVASARGFSELVNWNSKALLSSGIAFQTRTLISRTLLIGHRKTFRVTLVNWDFKNKQLSCVIT